MSKMALLDMKDFNVQEMIMDKRERRDSDLLTIEEIMTFSEAQLKEAIAYFEKRIAEVKSASPVTSLVINNDVGSRNTPELFKEVQLKPLETNLRLVSEALENRKAVMDFLSKPDPDLDGETQEPSNN